MKSFNFNTINEVINYFKENSEYGFVVFTTPSNVKELFSKVNSNVILCSTSGEYTSEGFKSNVITGFSYDIKEVEVVEIQYPPIKSLKNLKDAYKKVENNKNAFVLLLCDGLSGMEESIMTTFFFTRDDFKIIGGSAGDYTEFKETLIYIGNKKVHSVALFVNSKRKTQIIKENIYVPSGTRLLVTEADPINRVVKSFNNKPATREYANALGIKEGDLADYFMNNPLGKMNNNNIYISSPMKVNEDKSITFYCQILPNTFVEVLKPCDPIEKIKETFREVSFTPSFLLAINCILRSLKFQQDGIWKELDKEILSNCSNTTGFICYGEQFYRNHFNQTMVLLLIE